MSVCHVGFALALCACGQQPADSPGDAKLRSAVPGRTFAEADFYVAQPFATGFSNQEGVGPIGLAFDAQGDAIAALPRAVFALAVILAPGASPDTNEKSAEVALGRRLFFDNRLSADGTISCASCHKPEKAFTDGRPVAVGIGGRTGTRNTPTLIGIGSSRAFFWDGRRDSLEEQIGDPFLNENEHGLPSHEALLGIIRSDPAYARLSIDRVKKAIAAYLRTLSGGSSAFDRFRYGGDRAALSEAQARGLGLFEGRGRCASCHLIGPERALLADGLFHAGRLPSSIASQLPSLTSLVVSTPKEKRAALISARADVAELGRFVVTLDPNDIGKFKTPSLREVARTAPYLHDGSASSLEEAIEREGYSRGSSADRPLLCPSPSGIWSCVYTCPDKTTKWAMPDPETGRCEKAIKG